MAPKLVVQRRITSLSLIDAFPGGQMRDLTPLRNIEGPAVSGVFRNLGTEPDFEVINAVEEIKLVMDGALSVIEDG